MSIPYRCVEVNKLAREDAKALELAGIDAEYAGKVGYDLVHVDGVIEAHTAWHQEDRMGSIEVGKIANMTVFDCDFLHDESEKVANAKVVATIVDGEEVYKP